MSTGCSYVFVEGVSESIQLVETSQLGIFNLNLKSRLLMRCHIAKSTEMEWDLITSCIQVTFSEATSTNFLCVKTPIFFSIGLMSPNQS